MVEALTQVGYNQGDIAVFLGIDEKTLRKHYERELDFGLMKLLAGVVNSLGRMALGAPAVFDAKGNKLRDEIKPELGAACFIMKTRGKGMGWSERLEVTGKDGGPMQHQHEALDDVRAMIAEEAGQAPAKPLLN